MRVELIRGFLWSWDIIMGLKGLIIREVPSGNSGEFIISIEIV